METKDNPNLENEIEDNTSLDETTVETEDDSENNLEKTLEEESFLLKVNVPRATEQEFLDAIKSSLCTCNDCHTRFIKRKEKKTCPICHSTNIS